MDFIKSIKNLLPSLNPNIVLKSEIKTTLLTLLENFKTDENELDNDVIDDLIDILKKKKIDKSIKTQIEDKTKSLVVKLETSLIKVDTKSAAKPKTVYKPASKPVTKEIVSVKDVEDTVPATKLTPDEVAEMLDREIPSYNKWDKEHPMLGITWTKQNKWRMRYNNKDTDSKELDKLTIEMRKNITPKNQEIILKNGGINFIQYKGKYIVLYESTEEPLFDIQHILALLDIKDPKEKYNVFKNKITHYGFKKNEYGGYILKEFIPEEAMYLSNFLC